MNSIVHDSPGLLYGLVVGISLGLTGGGGSIFAVPLLIYGLGIPVRSAISLSLAIVGALRDSERCSGSKRAKSMCAPALSLP